MSKHLATSSAITWIGALRDRVGGRGAQAPALLGPLVSMTTRALSPSGRETGPDLNARLAAYVGKRLNHRRVRRDVKTWHTGPCNGAVAFVATALRHVGVAVPLAGEPGSRISGLVISLSSRGLSRYLEEQRRWRRVEDAAALCPGDVVFTKEALCCPGIPDHVFVFQSWVDRGRAIARVVDHQGAGHVRPLRPGAGPARDHASGAPSPFDYALRA